MHDDIDKVVEKRESAPYGRMPITNVEGVIGLENPLLAPVIGTIDSDN